MGLWMVLQGRGPSHLNIQVICMGTDDPDGMLPQGLLLQVGTSADGVTSKAKILQMVVLSTPVGGNAGVGDGYD